MNSARNMRPSRSERSIVSANPGGAPWLSWRKPRGSVRPAGRRRVVLLHQRAQLRVLGKRAQFVGFADSRLFHWERRFSSPVKSGLMRGADRKKPTKKPSIARTVVRPRWLMNIDGPRGTARCALALERRGALVRKLLPRLGFSCATSPISGTDAEEDAVVVSHSVGPCHFWSRVSPPDCRRFIPFGGLSPLTVH